MEGMELNPADVVMAAMSVVAAIFAFTADRRSKEAAKLAKDADKRSVEAEKRAIESEEEAAVQWQLEAKQVFNLIEIKVFNTGTVNAMYVKIDPADLVKISVTSALGLRSSNVEPGSFLEFTVAPCHPYDVPKVLHLTSRNRDDSGPERTRAVGTRAWVELLEVMDDENPGSLKIL